MGQDTIAEGQASTVLHRLLYTSLVDVSIPNGPGVNERTFLADLLERFGRDLHAVIPVPSRGMPVELRSLSFDGIPSWGSVRQVSGWLTANLCGPFVLRRAAERFRPDLVVMRLSAVPIPQFILARSEEFDYAIKTAGDLKFRSFYGKSILRRGVRPLNDTLISLLLDRALCIDVVTEDQSADALAAFPHLRGKLHVVDNGVELHRFTPDRRIAARRRLGVRDDSFVVGFVGNFPMRRGGREVVDAVASLRGRGSILGIVVGDSGEAEACKRYAEEQGVGDLVSVVGEVDYVEVPDFMAAMDVGLSMLRSSERGMSEQKVRQYLATGLCVVGSSIGSNDYLYGQRFGKLVDPENRGSVIEAVASFAALSDGEREDLRSKARKLAEETMSVESRNSLRLRLWGDFKRARMAQFRREPGSSTVKRPD